MKKRHWGFYPMFVLVVAVILVFSLFIGTSFMGILFTTGALETPKGHPFLFLLIIAIPSVVIGLIVSLVFGKKAVEPLEELSEGLNKVASGDFSVRLRENRRRGPYGEVNKNFNQMVAELASIEMLRDDFIVNVSHEYKSPLSSIQGYATLLQDSGLNENERRECLDAIMSATRSLSNMSSNILVLSNLETQTTELLTEEFSLDEQLRQVIVMLEPLSSEKGIELDVELEDAVTQANPELLEMVWINLMGNAIKFTDEGGRISVRLDTNGTHVAVAITDTGCGMDKKELTRVFDKFYQADNSHGTEGNGLGLALSHAIVKRHAGSIEAASEPKKGSTFTVRLPLG